MKRNSDFPPELEALFRAVITDGLAMVKTDPKGFRIRSSSFSPEGQNKYEALKDMIDTDPELESRFLDSRDWCRDDDEMSLSLDINVRRYITLAIERQVALGRLELTQSDFEELWREIREYALRETLDWKFVAPVKHLMTSGIDSVSLSEWCKIRHLVEEEVEKPRDENKRFIDPPPHCGIEIQLWGEPRRYHLAPAAAKEPLAVACAVLRLFKSQPVWLNSVTASSNSLFDRKGLTWRPFEWTGYRVDPYCTDHNRPYSLERHDVKRLSSAWEALWVSYHDAVDIRRSLDLYNEAFEQSTLIAAFLRVWGAIEAAFVPRGTRRISEVAANTLAELLEPVGEARDDTKRRLREAYRHRSEIVHGGRQLSDSEIMSSCAFVSKSYRRASLIRLRIQGSEESA
jgi:hypothetical protein